jgi:hypothetical protein
MSRSTSKQRATNGGDTAVVVLAGHEDVALVTPVLGPAVLDDPVVSALTSSRKDSTKLTTNNWVGAEADGKHFVVEVVIGVAAGGLIVDTAAVEHEGL